MKPSEIKQEYQLQQWAGMVRDRQESGLTIRQWCEERGITEHTYYYRLKRIRRAACSALEEQQSQVLAELPLNNAAAAQSGTQLQVQLAGGTVSVTTSDISVVKSILQVLMHAE